MSKNKKRILYLISIMIIIIFMSGNVLASSVSTIVGEISNNNFSKITIGLNEQTDENTENDGNAEENEELDPNAYISMPLSIFNGKATITISSSVSEAYTLDYQFIEIADADFQQMQTLSDERQEYYDNAQAEQEELLAEIEALREDYNAKNEEDPSSEETLAAAELLNETIEAYNNRINEMNEELMQYSQSIEAMIPSYDDTKWVETQDGEIDIQTSGIDMTISGTKHFALWARLQVGQDTYYDRAVYSTTITPDEEDDNQDNTNNVGNNTENNNRNNVTDNTVANRNLPRAGQFSIAILIVLAMLVAWSMYLGYKKYKDIK